MRTLACSIVWLGLHVALLSLPPAIVAEETSTSTSKDVPSAASTATLVAAESPSFETESETDSVGGTTDDPATRRNRRNEQVDWMLKGREAAVNALAAAESTMDAVSEDLEQMWARESELATSEVERLLQGFGSMPPRPAPTLAPVSAAPSAPAVTPTPTPLFFDQDCLQGRIPEQYLLDELQLITDNVSLLLDPTAPQGRAYNFLLTDPALQPNVCAYPTLSQRYGLGKSEQQQTGRSRATRSVLLEQWN